VSAGYDQKALVDKSGMIRTQEGTHNRSEMVAVYGEPCAIPPRNSYSKSVSHGRSLAQWYSTGGTRRHLRGYVDYTICITCIMYQQLWGYKVEAKLYLRVREQKRLNTTALAYRKDTKEANRESRVCLPPCLNSGRISIKFGHGRFTVNVAGIIHFGICKIHYRFHKKTVIIKIMAKNRTFHLTLNSNYNSICKVM
jgi:hypothetical protein